MKKSLCLALIFVMLLNIVPLDTYANEITSFNQVDDGDTSWVRVWENPTPDEWNTAPNINPRYGEQQYTEVINTQQVSVTTTPSGQPSGGYSFPNYGGSIYVNTSGGGSDSFSVSVNWGIISIGVSKGLAGTSSSIGGISVNVPADNNHYLVKLRHNCTARYLKIDYYQYNVYVRTEYITKTTVDSIDALLVRS